MTGEEIMEQYRESYSSVKPDIAKGIEKYRKADAMLIIVDRNGNPLPGVSLKIRQKTHAFDFGCNALMLGQLGKDNEIYEQKFLNLFNLVTTTLCWSITETEPGKFRFAEGSEEIFRRPPADRVRNFAKKHSLRFKGQPLLADSWYPDWASRNKEELMQQYSNYFKTVAERYRDDLYIVDVVNESNYCRERTPDFPLLEDGELSYVEWALRKADEFFPDTCILERNEGTEVNIRKSKERYFQQNQKLLSDGVRLNSIGFQFHMLSDAEISEHLKCNYLTPKELFDNYMDFCRLGIPMYISEVTVPSRVSWLSREEGEQMQAEVIENLYHLWFSVPNMNGIIYWNLKDGPAWKKEGDVLGCLLDSQMCEKPSYQTLYQLINRKWKTHIDAVSAEDGSYAFRGFKGQYDVEFCADGREQSFTFELKEDMREPYKLKAVF